MHACTEPRVGLLAYSTNTGLGIQTHEFARHLDPARILLVDLSALNHAEQHPERYDGFDVLSVAGFPTASDIDRFLDGLDVVFVAETPLFYDLFARARARGVKTILQPNHEFNDYYARPHLPLPDLFGLPSVWHYDDLPYENKMHLPVPVALDRLPRNGGSRFRRFLHIAGRPAVHDRNGTAETIAAFRAVTCPGATLTVRVQGGGEEYRAMAGGDGRIMVDDRDMPRYGDAYRGFDVLVLPRKYGGLCLPMQEALGSGMPVIMTDVSPNDAMLPPEWLVPATHTGEFMTRTTIDIHTADVPALTDRLETFCALDEDQAAYEFAAARTLGAALSWDRLAPLYRAVLAEVARG